MDKNGTTVVRQIIVILKLWCKFWNHLIVFLDIMAMALNILKSKNVAGTESRMIAVGNYLIDVRERFNHT